MTVKVSFIFFNFSGLYHYLNELINFHRFFSIFNSIDQLEMIFHHYMKLQWFWSRFDSSSIFSDHNDSNSLQLLLIIFHYDTSNFHYLLIYKFIKFSMISHWVLIQSFNNNNKSTIICGLYKFLIEFWIFYIIKSSFSAQNFEYPFKLKYILEIHVEFGWDDEITIDLQY